MTTSLKSAASFASAAAAERANEGGNCTVPFPPSSGGWLVGWSRKRQVHLGRGSVVIVQAAGTVGRTDGRTRTEDGRRTDEMPVDRRAEEEEGGLHPAAAVSGGGGGGLRATEKPRDHA